MVKRVCMTGADIGCLTATKSVQPNGIMECPSEGKNLNSVRGDFVAEARLEATMRSDAIETKDDRAIDDMLDYVKCEPNVLDASEHSEVGSFYAGKSVFITGASGFLGKCLLEKLLRSCPNVERVFILMRPKKGQQVAKRVEELLKSELFNRLRESSGGRKQLNKIKPIEGDITRPLLGLSEADVELLASKVSIIFHSAATVKFIEPLKVAIESNVVSVDNLLDLASKLSNLKGLVHISTAFSNCERKNIDEAHYELPIEAEKLIDMSRWMDVDILEKVSPILMQNRTNSYTFTKATAESLLVYKSKRLLPTTPVAIVRPSIVTGVWRQPVRGWVDNYNAATGVILSMATGASKAMVARSDYCADIVPVDLVASLIICSGWIIQKQQHRSTGPAGGQSNGHQPEADSVQTTLSTLEENNNLSIFNCVSGTLNPISWGDFAKFLFQIALIYPCDRLIRRPGALLITNQFVFDVFNFLNQTLVAYLMDLVLMIVGKRPELVKLNKRILAMTSTLIPFTTNRWNFDCSNVTSLYDRLSPIDKSIFNFDIRQVRWDDYLRRYYIGAKLYAMKDNPEQIVKSRHRLRSMNWTVRMVTVFLLITFTYFVFT